MKLSLVALTLTLAEVQAQLVKSCSDANGGPAACTQDNGDKTICQRMTVEEVAAAPVYGKFQPDIFGADNTIQVGTTNDLCLDQGTVDCRAANGNRSTNDKDLTCFLANYPGACDGLGLTGAVGEPNECIW